MPGRRHLHAASAAVEQADAVRRFQRLHLRGQGGLAHASVRAASEKLPLATTWKARIWVSSYRCYLYIISKTDIRTIEEARLVRPRPWLHKGCVRNRRSAASHPRSADYLESVKRRWSMTGARATRFIRMNKRAGRACRDGGGRADVTVPMQGTGTFAVEAMLTTFIPQQRQGAAADQRRLRPARKKDLRDRRPRRRRARDAGRHAAGPHRPRGDAQDDPAITHVFTIHCETTTGILNPIEDIARDCDRARPPVADRFHERLRRARSMRGRSRTMRSPPPRTSASRACRVSASSSAARRARRRRATPRRWCSTCTTSAEVFEKTGQYRLRRRSTSSLR